ncbi:MAG: MurR/RpiR family transcriptional regulator [Anaerolineaceae bacterium]
MDQPQNIGFNGDTLARVRGLLPSLSPAERKVGEYVLDNSEKIIRMTLAEIANQIGVSDATAIRFCRSLGYEGWLEFKIALVQALPHSPQLIHSDISLDDDPGVLARKIILGSKQALDDTLALLDEKAFNKAVNLLSNAQSILIAGVGTSGPMTHEMYNRLFRLGLNCQVQTDSYLQIMQVSLLTPQDVLVVISQGGVSLDPRRTAAEAKRLGVPVICITGNAPSQITSYADVILLSVSQESMPETISSRIAQYALIHALYVSLAMKSMDQSIEKEQTIWKALMRKFPYQAGDF